MKSRLCGVFCWFREYTNCRFKTLFSVYRAQVRIKGHREPLVRPTKVQAVAWATERETEIRNQKDTGIQKGKTFEDACRRYELEMSKHKRGHRWEVLRHNLDVQLVCR